MDGLDIDDAIVAGYDWGGRAACISAALWPERIRGLVTVDGYNIQDIAHANEPSTPAAEASYWYQYYFHSERGRRGLKTNREELCELLWSMWSPTWRFGHEVFATSAPSLHNQDFVDVVIHSYRHRYGLVPGDDRYEEIEKRLAATPAISVPTVVLESGSDGVLGPSAADDRALFTGPYRHVFLADVGHNVPQEAPVAFAEAVLSLFPDERTRTALGSSHRGTRQSPPPP
jgi:pimeloyl-ACP methyl ester carboxylesterase